MTIQCVFASLSRPAVNLQKMLILTKKIIFSDEAHFDLGGYVNKQNWSIWRTQNPHAYIEKPTHPKRVTVWCGFCSRGIIGPFYFENEQGEAETIDVLCAFVFILEINFQQILSSVEIMY